MKVLSGQNLIDEVRSRCERLANRLWIASPFIGNWVSARKILGTRWVNQEKIDVRLITEDSNIDATAFTTVNHFRRRGLVKTLPSLHAKIYIIDDHAIVTSANLTGAAFFKRYEAGVLLSGLPAAHIFRLFENWWKEKANVLPSNFVPKITAHRAKSIKKEVSGSGLKTLWKEPNDPGDPFAGLKSEFGDYSVFLKCYKNFAGTYSATQRIWRKSPLFFETDAFLNYLFHEAPRKPSQKYKKKDPRSLEGKNRINEIRKYATMFREWLSSGEPGVDNPQRRSDCSKLIRTKLAEAQIGTINRKDVEQVIDCLNCMNSLKLNRTMFLNPGNNKIRAIRNAWNILLHGPGPLEVRMSECDSLLVRFGRSSIQELAGFYYPKKYPLRNSNSNAGLRFFGYDVTAY